MKRISLLLTNFLTLIFTFYVTTNSYSQTLNNFYAVPDANLGAKRVIQTSDGGFIFLGGHQPPGDWTAANLIITKISSTGVISWSKIYDYSLTAGTSTEFPVTIVQTTFSTTPGYIVSGTVIPQPLGAYLGEGFAIKIDLNGNILWGKRFSNTMDGAGGGWSWDNHNAAFELPDKSIAVAIDYNGDNGVLRLNENGGFLNGTGAASSIVTNAAGGGPYNNFTSGEEVIDACLTNGNNNMVLVGKVYIDSTSTLTSNRTITASTDTTIFIEAGGSFNINGGLTQSISGSPSYPCQPGTKADTLIRVSTGTNITILAGSKLRIIKNGFYILNFNIPSASSPTGNWGKMIGLTGTPDCFTAQQFSSVIADPAGDIYVAGYTYFNNSGILQTHKDAILLKISAAGNLIYGKRYASATNDQWNQVVYDASTSKVIVTGFTNQYGSTRGVTAILTPGTGAVELMKTLDYASDQKSLEVAPGSKYYISGNYTLSGTTGINVYNTDAVLATGNCTSTIPTLTESTFSPSFKNIINFGNSGGSGTPYSTNNTTFDLATVANVSNATTMTTKILNPTVTVSPVAPAAVCASNGTATFSVTGTGSDLTYQWQENNVNIANGGVYSGAATNTLTLTNPGATLNGRNYRVVVTGYCGSATSNSALLTVNPLPVFSVTKTDATTCGGTGSFSFTITSFSGNYDIDLNGDGIYEYTNQTPNAGGVVILSGLAIGTVTSNSNIRFVTTNCVSGANATTLTIGQPANPAAPTVSTPVSYCMNEIASALTATGSNLLWYTVSTGGISSATAPTPSTTTVGTVPYYISQTTNNCVGPRALINVITKPLPAFSVATTNPSNCGGSNGQITLSGLTPSTVYAITYTKGAVVTGPSNLTSSAGGTIVISGLTQGTFSSIKATLNGCTTTDGTSYPLSDPTTPSNSTSTAAMCGDGVSTRSLTASIAGGTWSLATGSTASIGAISGSTFTVGTVSGTAIIRYTLAGCTADVSITVNPKPSVTITNPAAVCSPSSVNLTVSAVMSGSTGSLSYTYFTDAAATSALATPSAVASSGTYYIKGTTASGCADVKPVVVTINPKPTVVITNPAAVCSPTTVDLTTAAVTSGSTASLTYTYFTDASATSALASPTTVSASGTYYIKGITAATCTDVKPVVVTINPKPTVVTNNPAAVCSPATIDLTTATITSGSTASLTYTYFTNAAATSALASPSAVAVSGTYYIKGITAATCSDVKPVVVTINPKPTVVTNNPAAVCSPSTIDLTTASITTGSTASLTFTYFTDAAATSALASPSAVTISGTYYIKGTTAATCSDLKAIVVKVNPRPTVTITNPAAVCTLSLTTLLLLHFVAEGR